MPRPLLHFRVRAARSAPVPRRRRHVGWDTADEGRTDAIFLLLRRLQLPLLLLVAIFVISIIGMVAIPGQDADGRVKHLTVFEAFYFLSYTAATIGYGELGSFTTAQRMWVTVTIYLSVLGWTYAFGTMLGLAQDQSFLAAVRAQRFRRRVAHMREPFFVLAGYGRAGELIAAELDAYGHRLVVVDREKDRIEGLSQDNLHAEVPALAADVTRPSSLVAAGITHPRCAGLIAVTGDDEANLSAVMTASLARPDLPAWSAAHRRRYEARLLDFGADAVINPGDLFGAYLMLALERPATYALVTRLLSEGHAEALDHPEQLRRGRWLVVSDDEFGDEMTDDLESAGNTVDRHGPHDELGDLDRYVGVVAGATSDTINMSVAERAHALNPTAFTAVRHEFAESTPLLAALGVNAVYTPQAIVATELLARILGASYHDFIDHAIDEDEEWSRRFLTRLDERCRRGVPLERDVVRVSERQTPAVLRAAQRFEVRVGDLARDPDDRELTEHLVVLTLRRGDGTIFAPADDVVIRPGDELLVIGLGRDLDRLRSTLAHDATLTYVVTGEDVPTAWLWRRLTRRG